MLKLDISNLLAAKNIRHGYTHILRFGMSAKTAKKYLSGQATHINIDHMHRLCEMINCTPNDLFTFNPKDEDAAAAQPLAALRRPGAVPRSILFEMWNIPPEKATQAEEYMKTLLNG